MNYLDDVVAAQKRGEARGLTSICSAHPLVIEAVLRHGLRHNLPVLIEATCNQVNQFGGYTGMQPADFVSFVGGIVDRLSFPRKNLILGGDHLGPLVWSNQPAEKGMENARTLVREYVKAGFSKIHLDCSMPCADDQVLPVELVAQRAAELAVEAEQAASSSGEYKADGNGLRYVIGTEVPPAGGAKAGEDHLTITSPSDAAQTVELTRRAFSEAGLNVAWEKVIALVVQPGVEFGDSSVHEYDRAAVAELVRFKETETGLVFEAHSTDYQSRSALRELVEDHFALLKVGPRLTFAFRQAVFALAGMEDALGIEEPSRIREILEAEMIQNPAYWEKYYRGSVDQQRFSRLYSFSDRIRYYWTAPSVQAAFSHLLSNLAQAPIPLSLLSEYMPRQYEAVRSWKIENRPRELVIDHIKDVIEDYAFACGVG